MVEVTNAARELSVLSVSVLLVLDWFAAAVLAKADDALDAAAPGSAAAVFGVGAAAVGADVGPFGPTAIVYGVANVPPRWQTESCMLGSRVVQPPLLC